MDKLTYIEVGKEKYPIKCDNLVLQQIQEEFGSVRLFEMALIGLAAEKIQMVRIRGTIKDRLF